MNEICFEWDSEKSEINKRKHGVTFEEAMSVFYDIYALIIPDPDHSFDEERFIIMGCSFRHNLLVVCHCYRDKDAVIRIISARKATSKERKWYEGGKNNG